MTNTAPAGKPAAGQAAPQKGPELVEVTLATSHTHERKAYKAGDKINVTERQRQALIGRGVVAGPKEA
jgi:hypothetical protein